MNICKKKGSGILACPISFMELKRFLGARLSGGWKLGVRGRASYYIRGLGAYLGQVKLS
jgi:hypothetical protein